MPPRKKLGYNWKARQQQRRDGRKQKKTHYDGLKPVDSMAEYAEAGEEDPNAFVLPSKRRKVEHSETEKRKKLSSKQRKRLQKIVEAKEKKTEVCSN